MPRGDGTGPMGAGAMTGRAAGYCSGSGMPGYANPVGGRMGFGRGFGGGRGFGRGFGRGRGWGGFAPYGAGYYAPPARSYVPFVQRAPTPDQESEFLRGEAEYLEGALSNIRERLDQLEKKAGDE